MASCVNPEVAIDHFADIIVVGMGGAGAIVARQLSEAGYKVTGLEAGERKDTDAIVVDPAQNGALLQGGNLQRYFTEYAGGTGGLQAARVYGGGGTVGGMQYSTCTQEYWQSVTDRTSSPDQGWNAPNIRSIAKRLENFDGPDPEGIHGTGGPIDIRVGSINPVASAAFTAAVNSVTSEGTTDDYNSFTPSKELGSFPDWQLFQTPDGKRVTPSTAFLSDMAEATEVPIDDDDHTKQLYFTRSNALKIYSNATVNKVIFCPDDTLPKPIAQGVQAIVEGTLITFRARRGVILCAGLGSPAILQRSGIGNATLLNDNNIPIVFENENVGLHLKNHVTYAIVALPDTNPIPGTTVDPDLLYAGGAFVKSTIATEPTRRAYQYTYLAAPPTAAVVVANNLQPRDDNGSVKIQAYDPLKEPLVDFDGNRYTADVACNIEMIRIARDVIESMGNRTLEDLSDDTKIDLYVQSQEEATFHWTGGCRMGQDPSISVVDEDFKVFGVESLWVCDAMVLPENPDGNPQGAVSYIGTLLSDKLMNVPPMLTCPLVILPPDPPPLVLAPKIDTSALNPIKNVYTEKVPKDTL